MVEHPLKILVFSQKLNKQEKNLKKERREDPKTYLDKVFWGKYVMILHGKKLDEQ